MNPPVGRRERAAHMVRGAGPPITVAGGVAGDLGCGEAGGSDEQDSEDEQGEESRRPAWARPPPRALPLREVAHAGRARRAGPSLGLHGKRRSQGAAADKFGVRLGRAHSGAWPFLLSRRNHPVARDDGAPSRRGGGFEGGGVGAGRGRYGAGGPDGGRYCLFSVAAILPTVLRLAATIAATAVW